MPGSAKTASSALFGTLPKAQRWSAVETLKGETRTMRGILLWLIGIPIPIIILLWLFGVLH